MNKLSTFILAMALMLASGQAFAQADGRPVSGPNQSLCFSKDFSATDMDALNFVLEEDFAGTFPPDGWEISGLGQSNWSQSATNNAGGTAPEAHMTWTPQFNGVSRLESPVINTSAYSTLAISMRHYLSDYSGSAYSLLIETSTDGVNWNEIWSVSPTGTIDPELVSVVIDDGSIGSATFQFAITFSGNSYNMNDWYIDDVTLFEANSYDASVESIGIAPQILAGSSVAPTAYLRNSGTETISFDAVFELKENGSTVFTSTKTVDALAGFAVEMVTFDEWTAVLGDYEAYVTVSLTGDENPDNDMLSTSVQVLDNMVVKKQLIEEFTSATCAPCASANPIIKAVLDANPGEYSLIKYQMNWPGSGDIYYTQQGGDRRDYYGVTFVPDLYTNATQVYPAGSFSQTIFDEFAQEVTAMEIEVDPNISEENIITVDVEISAYANYEAGLTAHIVICEKTTTGNVGSNGETEFENVMMQMLPGSSGTILDAISQGGSVSLSESYDMNQTNMEEPTDLVAVVFVQNNNKEIIQSEMVDVEAGNFDTYDVTFNVEDSDGNLVEGAEIFFESIGSQTTNAEGQAVYENVFPGTYTYDITANGLFPASGSVEVIDQDVVENVVLEVPSFYFYEDFATEIPSDWTAHATNPDFLYWYDGQVIFFDQSAEDNPILLVAPSIDLSVVQDLIIETGSASQDPDVQVGTVSDPADPSTFTMIESFTTSSTTQTFTVDMSGYNGTDTHVAFLYDGPQSGFFSLFTVMMTEGGTAPSTVVDDFESYTAGDKLVEQALAQGKDFWTCWSGDTGAGGAEDATITDEFAASGNNSVMCDGTNDFVMLFDDLTEGKHIVSFDMYIPDGFVGYYNILQAWGPGGTGAIWGSEVYFNPDGIAELTAANTTPYQTFNYPYDTWFHVENVIDLNADEATLIVDGAEVASWQWSVGASGGGTNTLAAMDIYAAATNGTPKAYFDNVDIATATAYEIFDDLEAYNADEKLVEQALAQGLDFWTCWSGDTGAGSAEDGTISTEYAASGANSVMCDGTNDFVMLLGDKTEGKYAVSFDMLIPSGFVGYYNILQAWGAGGTGAIWGSEVYFNPDGIAEITAANTTPYQTFNYPYDTWFHVDNIIDLNADVASIMIDGTEVASWQWSVGASGGGTNTLAAMDIYAASTNGTPKAFFDNFVLENFEGLPAPTGLTATVNDNDITVAWNSPVDGFIGFNVYRDEVLIAEEITETSYEDMDLLPGYYMYDVKAVYDEGISAGGGPVQAYIEGGTSREMVLLEIGTGTWCQYCPGAAMGADDLIENGHNVAVIEYHNGDAYTTTQTDYRNDTYYGITGYPTANIDGTFTHVGGSSTVTMYETYLPSVLARSGKVSLFGMDINVVMNGETSVDADVMIDNIYPYPGDNVTLHVVLTESHIEENWQGQTELNFVCREMLPNELGTAMDFSSQSTYEGTFNFNIANYVKDNCEVVVFLQDDDTKEVLQAAKFDLEDIVGIGENPLISQVDIYPNPATDMLHISTDNTITQVRIMNHVGQLVFNRTTNGTSTTLNVSGFESGVYFLEVTTTEGSITQKVLIK